MLKYIELKTGQHHRGPAWVARVTLSRTGRTVYVNGRALKRAGGGGIVGNHFDVVSGEEYWISNVKKDGTDRHWSGAGKTAIEVSAVPEYLEITGQGSIDRTRFVVIPDLPPTDPEAFTARENARLAERGSAPTAVPEAD